ncbi:hypothetical protein RUM43_013442, partial [Polyplax serrata]
DRSAVKFEMNFRLRPYEGCTAWGCKRALSVNYPYLEGLGLKKQHETQKKISPLKRFGQTRHSEDEDPTYVNDGGGSLLLALIVAKIRALPRE